MISSWIVLLLTESAAAKYLQQSVQIHCSTKQVEINASS